MRYWAAEFDGKYPWRCVKLAFLSSLYPVAVSPDLGSSPFRLLADSTSVSNFQLDFNQVLGNDKPAFCTMQALCIWQK